MSQPLPTSPTSNSEILRSRVAGVTYFLPSSSLIEAAIIDQLRERYESAQQAGERDIVIDCTQSPNINSAGIECLLDLQDAQVRSGGSLKLSNISNTILRILELVGLRDSFYLFGEASTDAMPASAEPDDNQQLGALLLQAGSITQQQLDDAIALQARHKQRLGEVLLAKEWINQQQLLSALAVQLNVPYVELKPGLWDPAILETIPKALSKRLSVLPLFLIRNELTVATYAPQSLPAYQELQELTGAQLRPVLASKDNILKRLEEAYSQGSSSYDLISDLESKLDSDLDLENVDSELLGDYAAIDEMAAGSPVINLCNTIIQRAVQDGASDVHIEPSPKQCLVRFRIDGVLYKIMNLKPDIYGSLVSRLKVMANLDISERRLPQDGRIQVRTQGRAVDLRFSSLPGLYGEKVVLRVLDKDNAILDVERLGLASDNLDKFKQLLARNYGLILVTGPTGSGKTTSLYAALNHLNSLEKNIVTIEDPVEYQIELVNQNQVKDNIGLSFSRILRHVLRQDPDIVLVGEIRDRETAEIAVQAALTGHLVLSTLHTNDAAGAITRLLDMGIEPYLLSSALLGVVAQRLVRTICPSCKTHSLAPPELIERYQWQAHEKLKLARGRGCPECYDSGYRGRIALHELLIADEDIQKLIISSPSRDALAETLREKGVRSLFDDGLLRVVEGQTTIEEVSRVSF